MSDKMFSYATAYKMMEEARADERARIREGAVERVVNIMRHDGLCDADCDQGLNDLAVCIVDAVLGVKP